jgi:hypothetical protein
MTVALFLLRVREDYDSDPSYSYSGQIATGMYNSAVFVADRLTALGYPAEVRLVRDANEIDAVASQVDPAVVFVEGLWVTPAKLRELRAIPRHAARRWVVRVHSEIPFLASEGVAMGWIAEYLADGVTTAANSGRAGRQLSEWARLQGYGEAARADLLPVLPNYYPTDFEPVSAADFADPPTLEIACFGAFRPLKNHLQQATVAAGFAAELGKPLRFHVNCRTDAGGSGPARNVAAYFAALPAAFELVEHPWEDRPTFLQSLRDCHLLMQDSFSETFNIVAADATYVGRPTLGSDEISWLYPLWADPTDYDQALGALRVAWANRAMLVTQSRARLKSYSASSSATWGRWLAAEVGAPA